MERLDGIPISRLVSRPDGEYDLKTIAKNGEKFLSAKLKAVQKCRNDFNKGKLFGFAVKNCATSNSKAKASIAKADSKARAAIFDKCTDTQVDALDACDPPASTVSEVQDCIIDTHGDAADNPALNAPADLVDYEYATALACGAALVEGRPGRRGPAPKRGFGFGAAIRPSRMAVLRACLRARRTASAFSRALRTEGFS